MILLDRATPVLDGVHFLDAAADILSGIAVVWMTGSDKTQTPEHPAIVGVLRKPFDLPALLAAVRSYARSIPRNVAT